MFTLKKLALLIIVALCSLSWTPPASGQSGANAPPPHDGRRTSASSVEPSPTEPPAPRSESFGDHECSPGPLLHRPHDVDRLPDGHTLITDGGRPPGGATGAQPESGSKIIEVDEAGNVVWFFDQDLNWAHNADRLPSGNTLISDTGHDRVIEIDAMGTIVWDSDGVTLGDGSALDYPNDANRLPDDHLLITDRDNHRVIEIARDGTIVWQFGETGVPGNDASHLSGPHNADRLPSGNTIIADSLNDRIIEVAPDGTIAWQYPPPPPARSRLQPGASECWESERRLSSQAYRNQASGSVDDPLGLDAVLSLSKHTSLCSYPSTSSGQRSAGAGLGPFLDWPRDADRLSNGNTLIADSRHDRIIEVTPTGQMVWEYDDLDLPYDADRLSNGNTLISGSPSGGVVEVDFGGAIVWQYPPAPTGTIAGTVQDTAEQPISGVDVTVFGTDLSDTTDADGQYAITDVPVAAPRYIITASTPPLTPPPAGGMKGGGAQAGDVDVTEGMATTVDFTLEAGTQVTETLHAMVGYIVYRDPSGELLIPPPTAVLSPTLYPAEVLPYLEPGQYIESDDAAIEAVAQFILDGLTPEQRTEQTTVAHAVYVWMVQNIAYDLVNNYPGDVTCGNWQTTNGAWGHSFADWLYTASELLEEGRGICIEHARLATALLRAVGIPARPAPLMAHPVTQWWVQLPDGSGFWANMDTSKGRSEYVDSGDLWADFPSKEEYKLGFWAIDADAPIHLDWWTDNPCLWREAYGDGRRYPATADGLADAQAALAYFAQTGELPPPDAPPPPQDQPYYQLSLRGFEVDLTNAGNQTHFEVSFTLATESDYVQRIDETHWTNHPDWVTDAELETEDDPTTGESLTSYHIELDRSGPTHRVYLPLLLSPPSVPPNCGGEVITLVDNSLYYEGREDECWHKEDLPSPQPWFEETIPPHVGSTTTPLYFGIGVHIEPIAEYMGDFVYQQDRERLCGLAEIVAQHGGVLTIQTQTPFDDKAQQLEDTIFADLAAQGHEIALHFHEDAHIPDADHRPVEEWVTALGEEIDLIEELSGVEVRTWSGGNIYDHLYEAAEEVGLEININYKNPQTQQSDERYTILTPWRPAGASSMEERTTHDPDGAVIYIPSGVFPAHCDKLEAFPRPYCYEAFDYVTVALRNSLGAVTEGKVNAFYPTLHPSDFFGPGTDEDKLQVWDEWLTTVVDPLVADGRIQWATMSDIADAFVAWEESCRAFTLP
jgi:hypothetical protein